MQPMPPIPGKPPMAAQGSAPAGPAASPPSAGGPPGSPPGGAPKLPGPQPVANIGYNKNVQSLLFTRIQALNPQEMQALDQVITPQSLPVLGKIFPELIPLLNQSTAGKPTVRDGGPPGQPPLPPGGGGAAPGGPPGGMPPGQPSASGNPLTNPQSGNPDVSKGLTGGY